MERRRRDDGVVLKKGPWTAEEDEVLLEFVGRHGPHDWSSIRSKGLLPRSGKSCRLRWVNKLRPDLKTGCKFSAEEERIVLELQAKFGNKWAKIATYLEGRTDNDVKNFWSTRQKRLARLLHSTASQKKSQRNTALTAPVSREAPVLAEAPGHDRLPSAQDTSSVECRKDISEATALLEIPEELRQKMSVMEPVALSRFQSDIEKIKAELLPQFPLHTPPEALEEFPQLLDEANHGGLGFMDMDFQLQEDPFAFYHDPDLYLDGLPVSGLQGGCSGSAKVGDGIGGMPDCFFDDFPIDMLD